MKVQECGCVRDAGNPLGVEIRSWIMRLLRELRMDVGSRLVELSRVRDMSLTTREEDER